MVFTCRSEQSLAGVGCMRGGEWGIVEEETEGTRSLEEGGRKHPHRTEIFLLIRCLHKYLCF